MAKATGTLAWLNEFLSDTPTDINVIHLRATLILNAINTIGNNLKDKLEQTPGPIEQAKLEEQTLAQINALGHELERLLQIKRRLQSQKS